LFLCVFFFQILAKWGKQWFFDSDFSFNHPELEIPSSLVFSNTRTGCYFLKDRRTKTWQFFKYFEITGTGRQAVDSALFSNTQNQRVFDSNFSSTPNQRFFDS
jgi:hypothetical protein